MFDPDFDRGPILKTAEGPTQRRFGARSIFLGGLVLFVACWFVPASFSSRRFTCAVCRESKVETSWLGLSRSSQEETDCSRWYRDNVEPTHAHAWASRGFCRRIGFFGMGGFACSIGPPITGLSERVQVEIYQHFSDRLEAKRLFLQLARWDDGSGRRWSALEEWIGAGYPGTWDDWWRKHQDLDPS